MFLVSIVARQYDTKKKKTPIGEDECFLLEGHVDQNWNTIYPCLLYTYSKLKHLGFLYLDGEISYPEEVQDV